ncbi:MAG: bis(5'-nucleosyl)-tetraphosphatase (symmetrical) YqeK [Eubacteriales bacterium]|nr:bis(5'-nucleosyl)-tetraphosphatase (symmetrical) YqeK [Eubacteriales bacterium]MDD4582766.1 bis(5'-nucleosyl)-tetraphosphatase (symmetrical) YqeK [Eubacteriales bacterium]
MENTSKEKIIEYLENVLSEKRKRHTYSVASEAVSLAQCHNVPPEKAELAALFHDMYRGTQIEILDNYVRSFNLDSSYLGNSNLAHGKIAGVIMEQDYGIQDRDIINAVAFHTTGREGMSDLEKILYLADAIEPGRKYPGVEEIRKLAYVNLNQACLKAMNRSVDYIRSRGLKLDRDTIRAKNFLMEQERMKYE